MNSSVTSACHRLLALRTACARDQMTLLQPFRAHEFDYLARGAARQEAASEACTTYRHFGPLPSAEKAITSVGHATSTWCQTVLCTPAAATNAQSFDAVARAVSTLLTIPTLAAEHAHNAVAVLLRGDESAAHALGTHLIHRFDTYCGIQLDAQAELLGDCYLLHAAVRNWSRYTGHQAIRAARYFEQILARQILAGEAIDYNVQEKLQRALAIRDATTESSRV